MTSRLRLSGIALATAVAAGTLSTVAAVPSASARATVHCTKTKDSYQGTRWWKIGCSLGGHYLGNATWFPDNPEFLEAYDARNDHRSVIARLRKTGMSSMYVYDAQGGGRSWRTVASRNWDKTSPQLCFIWGRDRHVMRCMT